jgi:hypothetical protein
VWKRFAATTMRATRKRAANRDDYMHACENITLRRTRALYQQQATHDLVHAISFVQMRVLTNDSRRNGVIAQARIGERNFARARACASSYS